MAKVTYDRELTGLLVINPYNDFISEGALRRQMPTTVSTRRRFGCCHVPFSDWPLIKTRPVAKGSDFVSPCRATCRALNHGRLAQLDGVLSQRRRER